MPNDDTDYRYYINMHCRTCLANHMGFISRHIIPLVIYSLGGGYTHTRTRTRTHTHTQTHTQTHVLTIRTESILRNQVRW